MQRVLKYNVTFGENRIPMPAAAGAIILAAGVQGDDFVIWVQTEVGAPQEMRRIIGIETGVGFPEGPVYRATAQRTSWMRIDIYPPRPPTESFLVMHIFDGGVVDA